MNRSLIAAVIALLALLAWQRHQEIANVVGIATLDEDGVDNGRSA